jgi:TetR/AcrR family transcriptional repressor of nem operon
LPQGGTAARLVVAMSAELSLVEQVRGDRDPDGRATLWQLLARLDLGATS